MFKKSLQSLQSSQILENFKHCKLKILLNFLTLKVLKHFFAFPKVIVQKLQILVNLCSFGDL